MQEANSISLHPEQDKQNNIIRKVTSVYENEGLSVQEALNNAFNLVCYYAMALNLPEDEISKAVHEGVTAFKANHADLN